MASKRNSCVDQPKAILIIVAQLGEVRIESANATEADAAREF